MRDIMELPIWKRAARNAIKDAWNLYDRGIAIGTGILWALEHIRNAVDGLFQ